MHPVAPWAMAWAGPAPEPGWSVTAEYSKPHSPGVRRSQRSCGNAQLASVRKSSMSAANSPWC